KWGIREPLASCAAVQLDIVDLLLVPGVAFDRRGHRLGYGKGYYDRLLPARRPAALLAALAFDCQLVDEVPVSEHDVSIDLLITPSQQLSFIT
ncbi:MAG: 5-formyltetrahydrofolate cyclo-ligase, partial [Burkholderiales bacterium]